MASSKSGHPESNQGPSDLCNLYSQILYQLSFRSSISNLAYSEPGSPFPECREGLTDRLSNSVLLPGIEPRTGRKRDAGHNHGANTGPLLYQLSYSRLDTNYRIPSRYTEHAA